MEEKSATIMAEAKQHIEEIRKERFWIGQGKNPLSRPLRMAVKYLSAELYSKDVHFLMELIQNAEDNEYPIGTEPSLEFIVTSRDITASGAPSTLLVFNNEKGFSRRNIESICSVGDSTKAGNRKHGYIGEKGIGFKSVFLLTAEPYIFSNGYQIRFSETPCPDCDIAYIVPEWVDNNPSVSQLQQIYGRDRTLPTTTLILPLKPDKVKVVKEQLSCLHPELLLFLTKIKRLSVKEDNDDPKLDTIRAISLSREKDFVAKKNFDAESYTVHLAAEDDAEGECRYYMWRQRFPVRNENKVEKRMDVEECVITLAFPFGKRLCEGTKSSGIYAFLPTETVTNLPFIIQADFLLPSSRETILWDDKWNQGILDCVPTAFINAFLSLVKSREDAHASSLASMFVFIPVYTSSHPKLNAIRESIREKLLQESIILSESHSTQKFFHKPDEVGQLMPAFWTILLKAKEQGAKLHNLSSHGKHIVHSSFDNDNYKDVLNFLAIKFVDADWYPKCIQSCNLVSSVGDEVYVELLCFLAKNWTSHFNTESVKRVPLLKYVDGSGNISLASIDEAICHLYLCQSQNTIHTSWLIDWSKEFMSTKQYVFLPEKIQERCSKLDVVLSWLRKHVKVETLNLFEYATRISNLATNSSRLALAFAHFLHHSFSVGYLSKTEVQSLCSSMPLLDSCGDVSVNQKRVLIPASGSKWVDLMGSNPWRDENFVDLAEVYLHTGRYAGHFTPENELIKFLCSYACASDIPEIQPPNSGFPAVSGPLTKDNVVLLLDWISHLRSRGTQVPAIFLNSIKNGSWLRVTTSGCSGYKPPCKSFVPDSSWGTLLQNGSDMVDIPLVDQAYYDNKLQNYTDELKALGVIFEYGQACESIGKHLMSMAADYNLTRTKVFAMLNFIRFLRKEYLSVAEFINSIRKAKWVKTSCDYMFPIKTVLYSECWEAASAISDIPFLDQDYYGKDIVEFKEELTLLGVKVDFDANYQIVFDHLKPSRSLNSLMPKALLFALKCFSNCQSSELLARLKSAKCLKTNMGFLSPSECFLLDREWGCILQVFEDTPYIDEDFYGSEIFQYEGTLKKIGVVVDFDVAIRMLSTKFESRVSTNSFTKENALSFITCYRTLKAANQTLPDNFLTCIKKAKWLRTRLGDCRSPKDCILFNPNWLPISQISLLPFVNDSDKVYGKGIHDYTDELKSMGVIVDLKEGAKIVLSHIFFPQDPTVITPGSFISLLQCIKNSKLKAEKSFPEAFLKQVRQSEWLNTTAGYRRPQECLLFDPEQKHLQQCDGPFIDEEFYGPLSSYKAELLAIGVTIDIPSANANSIISSHLNSLTEFSKIERVYEFLSDAGWKTGDKADNRIWFPTSSDDGLWVSPDTCVLYDKKGLFKSRLHVLDQGKYKPKLLEFFSRAFKVRSTASTDDYFTLWKEWENSKQVVSFHECIAFWEHVIWNCNSMTEKVISERVSKIPAVSDCSSDIILRNKRDVFIPDDLLLKDLFEKSSPHALFIWCPEEKHSSSARRTLIHIYSKIGVRRISEAVGTSQVSDLKGEELNQVKLKDAFIVKGLVMLILGFLADPELNIEVQSRHETVKKLLKVGVFQTAEPIAMSYTLELSSGNTVKVSTCQMVRWDKDRSEFYTQKLDKSVGRRSVVEYATKFSDVVSEGLLWDKNELIPRLSELIKFGFLMDFDEDAVAYFMKSKNLQIFAEDKEFLSSAFPSDWHVLMESDISKNSSGNFVL